MAVQTVFLPLSFKYDPYEARFNEEYRKAKSEVAVSKREEAQEQLNALLAEGYTVVTQTNVESRSGIDLAIVMYKPDDHTCDDENIVVAKRQLQEWVSRLMYGYDDEAKRGMQRLLRDTRIAKADETWGESSFYVKAGNDRLEMPSFPTAKAATDWIDQQQPDFYGVYAHSTDKYVWDTHQYGGYKS